MNKQPSSHYRIPSFRGFRAFKPLEPERDEDLLFAAVDPSLRPEERGEIKRYLQYADTLINGSDETPADNGSVREVSQLEARRSDHNKAA